MPGDSSPPGPLLELRSITKRFGGLTANDAIDLKAHAGETLGLLGENGAGKTTLMNIIYGLHHPDEGEILLRGAPVCIENPRDAIRLGIGMVHQHFTLVGPLTVVENIILGAEPHRGPLLDSEAAADKVSDLAQHYGLDVHLHARVQDLAVGQQQRVEILKALYRDPTVLLLDEPTAVLRPQEIEDLFRVLRGLAASGTAVILITHKLREVLSVADRIVVLRGGRVVGETTPAATTEESLAAMIVGPTTRPTRVAQAPSPASSTPGDPVLEVDHLRVLSDNGMEAVRGVSFTVRAGEVLGVAGVEGNGQRELVEAVTCLRAPVSGSSRLLGHEFTGQARRAILSGGVAHIPEDRQQDGLVLGYTLADNLALCDYHRPPLSRGFRLLLDQIGGFARSLAERFDIRAPSVSVLTGHLSGGNQQRAVAARELARSTRLIVASQPTRGLDVASARFVQDRLLAARDSGAAVLLVSSDLDELLSLAGRIMVLYRGQIAGMLQAADATPQQIGLLMAGAQLPSPSGRGLG